MATKNCTIVGQIYGHSYYYQSGDYAKGYNNDAYAGNNGTYNYAYVMKFTTPEFSGESKSIALSIVATDAFGAADASLSCAICKSDANRNNYLGAVGMGDVVDENQIATKVVYFKGLSRGDPELYSLEEIPVTGLKPNTDYYIVLFTDGNNATGVSIKEVDGVYGKHSIVLNYDESPAHVHEYTSVVIHPTCTEKGYTTHTCSCGDNYKDSYTNALGHEYDSGVITKKSTHESTGTKTYTCSRCGEKNIEEIPRLKVAIYIDNGSDFEEYGIYIDNGSEWEEYMLYIDNGSSWDIYC